MRVPQHEAGQRVALNIRIKPHVREVIARAAGLAGTTRTEFVLDAARRAAVDSGRALPPDQPVAAVLRGVRVGPPALRHRRRRRCD